MGARDRSSFVSGVGSQSPSDGVGAESPESPESREPPESPESSEQQGGLARRTVLRLGAAGAVGVGLTTVRGVAMPYLADRGWLSADGAFAATSTALSDALYTEEFPTSPLILTPFRDALAVPKALRPTSRSEYRRWPNPPGPGRGQQNSLGNARHQMWPNKVRYPDPIVYEIDLLVRRHSFTSSKVLPIDSNGRPTISFNVSGQVFTAGTRRSLPASTIYGFNGAFPGPMINAEYGRPCLIRFRNRLHQNPLGLDRQDFGSPDWSFLTHLHNGHTAPESDGNPHYSMTAGPKGPGYMPGMWVDNLYLNWPAGGDDREKQSFFWFHDHRMDHTGANVYKGMVGLYPDLRPEARDGHGRRAPGAAPAGRAQEPPRRQLRRRLRHPAGVLRLPSERRRDGAPRRARPGVPEGAEPEDTPQVVGDDVLQALPEPRLRRRHLHGQRHGIPGAAREAAEVPLPVPRRLRRPDLRVQADELHEGPEVGGLASVTPATSSRVSTGSRTDSSACGSTRSPPTAGCCPSRSSATRSSCGRPSGARSSSTSPATRMVLPRPRAT